MLTLHKELIAHISFFLLPKSIYNLSISNSYLSDCINLDWDKYFRYHTGYVGDLKIDKIFMINYGIYLLDKDLEEIEKMKIIIDEYKNNELYNELIKKNKPIFLDRSDFNQQYDKVFTYHKDKIVIINTKSFANLNTSLLDKEMY